MNLRFSVIFACILSVTASPLYSMDGVMDLKARGNYVNTPDAPAPEELDYIHGGVPEPAWREPFLTKVRKMKKARRAPKYTPKTRTKPSPDLAKRPPKSAPQPKTVALLPQAPKSSQNFGKPRPNTPLKGTPPQNAASCTAKRGPLLGKRAFDPTCDTATITLEGVTRSITKDGIEQGSSSMTYEVIGGWPDFTGKDIPAYAKTGKKHPMNDVGRAPLDKEAAWLRKVGQLLASGMATTSADDEEGTKFIVFRGVTGKHLKNTDYFQHSLQGRQCWQRVEENVIPMVVESAKFFVDHFQVFHRDIQPQNVLFTEENAKLTKATLIDWGNAETQPVWTDGLAQRVVVQASRSFLDVCPPPQTPADGEAVDPTV